ncbi:MAG: FAD-binding and (Fe-S)-binding domain-containing protein [Phycisphaerales bacterium]
MRLNVLNNTHADEGNQAGEMHAGLDELRQVCRGAVRLGRHERMLFATDASMYQVEPLGVVTPADVEDAAGVVRWCAGRGVAMLARGGGTALAGQTTNRALVVDLSARCRGIGAVEVRDGVASVEVEAGVTIDELNAELARRGSGLFFAPDPATTAQSCIGGNIGTNAAGARSVRYGRTSESLLGLDCVLATGARVALGPGVGRRDSTARELAARVVEITRRHERLIRERYPKTLRQNAGYALDRMLSQIDAGATPETLDLAQLVCGSEGTLAVTLRARLRLHPVPKGKGLALLAFATLEAAIEAVGPILETGPSAVELVDDVVIEAARGNIECSRYVDAFPRTGEGDPSAVLYVEYHEASSEAVEGRFAALRRVVGPVPGRYLTSAAEMAGAWKLRKAGEPLLHGLPGPRKPLTFVEDNAVPVGQLSRFVREFKKIVEREGTRAAFWAHASVGVLHVRPMLNPHDEGELAVLRRIAVEVADLARACGGVMSGEHGDGRVRGPLLERFFGPELMRAFGEVKQAFDPKHLLNPGNIVAPGPIESITEHTRIEPGAGDGAHARKPYVPAVETYYDYGDQEGFDHAVEMCNGAGVCRKTLGGTMCPSYRATRQERHSTRGRGNALRLAITGQFGAGGRGAEAGAWNDVETLRTLDLCLSCKACKTECPSNVDMSRLKAEYVAQGYRATGRVPLAALLTGHVRVLNRLGSIAPGLANWASGLAPLRWLIGQAMGMHARRALPRFSRALDRRGREWDERGGASAEPGAARVALFGDCFTMYNESEIGVSAARVLTRLGYRVEVSGAGCCGRSMISVGMLEAAIETVDATMARLRGVIEDEGVKAVLFVEPSCLSAVKDDWLQLRCRAPVALRRKLAAKAMPVEDFVDRFWEAHPRRVEVEKGIEAPRHHGTEPEVLLHGHCHQKALWGVESSARALRRVLGERLRVLETGCCGMAGSFGYAADKYEVSRAIAELPAEEGGLLAQVRGRPEAIIAAPGTSCRHQVRELGGREAKHPIEILEQVLCGPGRRGATSAGARARP